MKDIRNKLLKEIAEQQIQDTQFQERKSAFSHEDLKKCKHFFGEIEKFAIISDYHWDFSSVFEGFWGGNIECEVTLWTCIDGQLYAEYIGWIDIWNGLPQGTAEYPMENKTPLALGFTGCVKPESDIFIKFEAANGYPEVIFENRKDVIICIPMVPGIDANIVKYCAQLYAKKWGGVDIPLEHIFPGEWKIEKNMPENEDKAWDEILKSLIVYNKEVAAQIGIGEERLRKEHQESMNVFKENVMDKLVNENGCVAMRIGEKGENFQMQVKKDDKND